ncbi:Riboflavin synthase-like beta-barrel [Penicillium coprophilum]|uniref:Riboflavin synthase-like beta-barrel n=1 Tax=Penicillium coprophilum TaxID=36646 RepID=UPI0023A779DF|nr:Riboflavin synthase-like beta-barrel [Penicillium coprophilum]KAJ5164330.1 Riboflavin synthase-like beta-barrel [Penicillium coprophilum]
MTSLVTSTVPWHEGEEKLHHWLKVPHGDNPTTPYLSPRAASLVQECPLLALGTLDSQGRPWSTIWGGTAGFAMPVAESLVDLRAQVDGRYDPVVQALLTGNQTHAYTGKMVSGLAIDLENRRRVKLYGRMVAGSLSDGDAGEAQLVVHIEESLGNCPKYMNKKHIVPAQSDSKLISDSPQLSPTAIELLARADTMFISSSHGASTMDTNTRGGPPGFMRVESNSASGAVLVYPEYSGNRLYQTLGNLETTPLAGFVVPDFDSGNVLYFTGSTEILVGKDAAAILPRSNLAVRVTIAAAIFVENGLSFRGEPGDPSPYNPSVRYLVNEKHIPGTQEDSGSAPMATLIKKEDITPSIQRFRFRISSRKPISWSAGQYVTLSFEDKLNMGYSHMRDDDPSSLNDDYVRTFTVSSYPGRDIPADQFEIMVRRHGPVTGYLARIDERASLEVPLKGFGGSFHISTGKSIIPYVAGGIGITPLLAQLPELDISQLRLFWSISFNDLGLVHDIFQRWPQLPLSTTLFITNVELDDADRQMWDGIQSSGVKMIRRRMQAEDLDLALADVWFLCAGVALKRMILNWLVGKTVVYEDFNY